MTLKFLVPSVLALSALAVPALAYDNSYSYYNDVPITGSQMTDMPSERSNVTMTGSFLRPEPSYAQRYEYWARHHYRDYYRDYYNERGW